MEAAALSCVRSQSAIYQVEARDGIAGDDYSQVIGLFEVSQIALGKLRGFKARLLRVRIPWWRWQPRLCYKRLEYFRVTATRIVADHIIAT